MKQFFRAVTEGDQLTARRIIEDALHDGTPVVTICAEIIGPAMRAVGDLWEAGELNVAQEHLATEIVGDCLAYLKDKARRNPPVGQRCVVTCVQDERHELGARMLSEILYLDGWSVDYLGQDTPPRALVEYINQSTPVLVVLSGSYPDREEGLREAIAAVRGSNSSPALMVGGIGLSAESDVVLDADIITNNMLAALHFARKVAGLDEERPDLDRYLASLGERIQRLRHARGWSQSQLAGEAGLDRTYISGVERGKQNVTIGAVMKLADAFSVHVDSLLSAAESAPRPLP